MKSLSILGSTGSIGCSSLDVVAAFPDRFRVVALAAGRSIEKLAEQAAQFRPKSSQSTGPRTSPAWSGCFPAGAACRVVSGPKAWTRPPATRKGHGRGRLSGTGPALRLRGVRAGRRLSAGQQEPLVVAGELILAEARRPGAELLPVDSEHSAIHQALRGGNPGEARRLVLTASGGPFRERRLDTFDRITVEDALAHPTWKMGPKITIDSATMMNKGLEVIEAHFLFHLPGDRVDVVITRSR